MAGFSGLLLLASSIHTDNPILLVKSLLNKNRFPFLTKMCYVDSFCFSTSLTKKQKITRVVLIFFSLIYFRLNIGNRYFYFYGISKSSDNFVLFVYENVSCSRKLCATVRAKISDYCYILWSWINLNYSSQVFDLP